MNQLKLTLIFALLILSPTFSEATIEVPLYDCGIGLPLEDGTQLVYCTLNTFGPTAVGNDVAQQTYHAAMHKKASWVAKTYDTNEINTLLAAKDKAASQLRTEVEAELNAMKSLLPQQIGDIVERIITKHFQDTLRNLIKTDPDFRKAIGELLKDK